jgi:hypothetical protein
MHGVTVETQVNCIGLLTKPLDPDDTCSVAVGVANDQVTATCAVDCNDAELQARA